jgi:hypothetical protein
MTTSIPFESLPPTISPPSLVRRPYRLRQWNTFFVQNDFINTFTEETDPRRAYGTSNFDILQWDGLVNGTQKGVFETLIASLLLPGATLVSFLFCWILVFIVC